MPSRSPRKLLKRALAPLDEMVIVLGQYPEAMAELAGELGQGGVEELLRARDVIASAVGRLTPQDRPGLDG